MDFCDAAIGTVVRASQLSLDEYEVSNLISTEMQRRRRGFLVESFIKPPVDVIFDFPCDLDVSQIVLRPTVGSQRSTGLEVFGILGESNWHRRPREENSTPRVETVHGSGLMLPENQRVRRRLGGGLALIHFDEHKTSRRQNEFLLAKGVYENENEIIIVNEQFTLIPPFKEINLVHLPDAHANGSAAGRIKVHSIRSSKVMKCVRAVKIRIWKTANGSIPALGSVHVYACPALGVSKAIFDRLSMYQRRRHATDDDDDDDDDDDGVVSTAGQSCSVTAVDGRLDMASESKMQCSSDVAVPEAFTDPLTCGIMTLPVILPSGTTVDQITLDRFVEAEARWGRSPSDPFTGLPFSQLCKPISNVQLKAKIDRFLIRNEHLAVNGRTTGKKDYCSSHHLERLVEKQKKTKTSDVIAKRLLPPAALQVSKHATNNARSTTLEDVLRTSLGSLPSYTAFRLPDLESQATDCCSCKKRIDSLSEPVYRLPCLHVTCRSCVTEELSKSSEGPNFDYSHCPQCTLSFPKSEIVRMHTR